nr:MAG TPA: hypothetical protein [Caudoviricetes sp.]
MFLFSKKNVFTSLGRKQYFINEPIQLFLIHYVFIRIFSITISKVKTFHYAKYTFSNCGKGKRTYIFKIFN